MKKFIFPTIIVLIIIAIYIVITTVDFGALTISFLERTAHIEIEYENMEGNIFRGYRIERYNVKLSETDSIYGEIADITYRFKPLGFRLPNLFEINLIEPIVHIKKKTGKGEQKGLTLPRLSLGLRINVKNGKLVYEDKKPSTIEGISGLVFIDLIGTKIYLNTINLSLRTKEYPFSITSANLDYRIDSKGIEAKSFKIKGKGISLYGEGTYAFENNQLSLNIKKAKLNLETFGIHKGSIDFSGEVEYINNKLLPKIHGTAQGVDPVDRFNFETNIFADTIWINIFDGILWGGDLFAQVKFSDFKNWDFEANFNEIDVGNLIDSPTPILITGYMGYRRKQFIGFIKSPAERGLGIDSLLLFGSAMKSQIILDSLFILENGKRFEISGSINSGFDLNIGFNHFNVARFSKFIPLKDYSIETELTGSCRLKGDFKNVENILFTCDITGNDFVTKDIQVKKFSIASKDFKFSDQSEYLKIILENPSYKNLSLENVVLTLKNRALLLEAQNQSDSLKITGKLEEDWYGTISSLYIKYKGVETKNRAPITFDILHKNLGEIDLAFIDGSLKGMLSPLNFNLSNGDITKLGMLLGLKEPISGSLNFSLEKNILTIDARYINFMGMQNGSLNVQGEYKNKSIAIRSFNISDKNNQTVYASGLLSIKKSNIEAKVNDVGVWVFPFLNNFMIQPDGVMSGDIVFEGNLNDFKLTGSGEIKKGSFGIEVISAQFDSVQGKVTFDNNRIIFQSAKGRMSTLGHLRPEISKRAVVNAGGIITFGPRFKLDKLNFDFSFKDAPLQFQPFAYGVGSGNFSLGVKNKIAYYNGNITVKQAIVPLEFGQKVAQVEETEGQDNWTMNLKLKGERNIWLRNRDADIEFGGELYIVKEKGPLYLSGELKTHRGNYYWLNHVLLITDGKVTFIPEEIIDAELDIWAEMKTRDREPTTGVPITIKLHMFGLMSEPIFEFFSDPELYSEQDIVTYLNLNITWQELASMKQGDYVGTVLPNALVSWLESDVSRRIRQYTGLDYFRIETPFFEEESKTKLTVGKYISKDLFITYTYDMTSFSNEFNVEYFIDDKNEILIRRDEGGEYSLQYQYRIRF